MSRLSPADFHFLKASVAFAATVWVFAMTTSTRAAESYRWPLNEAISANLTVDQHWIRFQITNDSPTSAQVLALLSDAEYLKESVLRIQFSDPNTVGEAYPTFKLAGNGIPGTGSRFFLPKERTLEAGKSIEVRFEFHDALKAIDNPSLAKELVKSKSVFRIVASIDRQCLFPPQNGFLQFASPWLKAEW